MTLPDVDLHYVPACEKGWYPAYIVTNVQLDPGDVLVADGMHLLVIEGITEKAYIVRSLGRWERMGRWLKSFVSGKRTTLN